MPPHVFYFRECRQAFLFLQSVPNELLALSTVNFVPAAVYIRKHLTDFYAMTIFS